MSELCLKPVQKSTMQQTRPCIGRQGHLGPCIPDLTGMIFGRWLIIRRGEGKPIKHSHYRHTAWVARHLTDGGESTIRASVLLSGLNVGRNRGGSRRNGKTAPEYATVAKHWRVMCRRNSKHLTYFGMPFCDEWNPDKNGSFWAGAKWIVNVLGEKPGSEWSIDIIEHVKGFVPGNLRWAQKHFQSQNQQHRILGQFTDEEFQVEARKRGFTLTRIE